jgi:hypothetical protein
MAKMPQGSPRTVPDEAGDAYDQTMKTLKTQQGQQGTAPPQPKSSVGHPEFAESLIPIWGSGREAVADFQEGDYVGAGLNGALAASDIFLVGSAGKFVAKGGIFIVNEGRSKAPYAWRTAARPYLEEIGVLQKGQHGHHWLIPQNGWGKKVPEWLKNQPLNIKPMPEGPAGAEMHGRLTNSYKGKPRFNLVQRVIVGTPVEAKVVAGSAVGHTAAAGKAEVDRRK